MKSNLFTIGFLFLAALSVPHRVKAPPPSIGSDAFLPGKTQGTVASYWLAPYVKVSDEKVSGHRIQTVTWFSEDGSVKNQIAAAEKIVQYANPGYLVFTHENDRYFIHGVNEAWKCELPKKSHPSGPASATTDSRTLIYPFNPEHGMIAVDVYVHGVPAGTLGPFIQHRAEEARINEDGSIAMLIWKDAAKTTAQIVCADGDGKVRFRVDCDNSDQDPIPAPNGVGALLKDGMVGQKSVTYYTREGKGRTVETGGRFIGWVPGSLKSLFKTMVGKREGYELIDWDQGKVILEMPCPGEDCSSTAFTPRFLILAVLEWYKPGPWRGFHLESGHNEQEIIQTFYAADIKDGRLVARWQAEYPSRYAAPNFPRFVELGKKLYFLNGDEFTELLEDEILAGKNGWKSVTGEK